MADETLIAAMDDDIDEALQDAVSDGEGRITPYYLRHHLDKHGLRIVPTAVRAEELRAENKVQQLAAQYGNGKPFEFDPAHVETVKQALRMHGGTPPGLRQAAEYIERLEKRVKELEARS